MYWIWIVFTSPNEYLLDGGLGLVAKGTDWGQISLLRAEPSYQQFDEVPPPPQKYWAGGKGGKHFLIGG